MKVPGEVDPVIGSKVRPPSADARIASLAEAQHGVVARRQLLDAGIGARAIDHRLAVGRLHQHHRGVYSPGHRRLSRHGQWIAAVLAAGPRAVLSHRAAASLWNLRRFLSNLVDVTVPHGFHRRPGLCFHRAVLPPDEVTVIDAIPVTTVPRTVLDLAAVVSKDVLERACAEAEFLRLSDTLSLRDLLDRHPHRPGVALRAVLAEDHYRRGITKSVLEKRFLALLDEDGLPRRSSTWTSRLPAAGSKSIACGAMPASWSSSTAEQATSGPPPSRPIEPATERWRLYVSA